MKIIFLGSPQYAVSTLAALNHHHEIVAVITRHDKPVGRKKTMMETPISRYATEQGLTLFKPEKLTDDFVENLKALNPDIFVIFSYGKILKNNFLQLTPHEGLNIHPSLLPLYRGPSPVKAALLNGEVKTGISIQKVFAKVDTGDIYQKIELTINEQDDYNTIMKKVSELAPALIIDTLQKIETNTAKTETQDDNKASYCSLLKKQNGLINWQQSGCRIFNKIRALCKWPVAFTFLDNKRLLIYKGKYKESSQFSDAKNDKSVPGQIILANKQDGIFIQTGKGVYIPEILQLETKKITDWKSFLAGHRDLEGKIFSNNRV